MDSPRRPEGQRPPGPTRTALRISALYALVGGLWILFSDSALLFLVRDPETMARVAIAKGWVYVLVTAGMLFGLVQGAIQKLHRSQEALRRSEEDYRLLVENQTDLMVKTDADGRLLFVSQSYCELFGRSQDELLGATFWPLVHPDDAAAMQAAIRDLSRPPHTGYVETRAFTAKGARWIAWAGRGVLDSHGSLTSIAAVGRDITEKRGAEEALETHVHRLEALRDIEDAILATHSPSDVADAAVGHLRRLVPCRRVSIALLDRPRGRLTVTADDLSQTSPRHVTVPDSFLDDLPEPHERAVRRIADLTEDRWRGPLYDHLRSLGLRSVIAAPLQAEGELFGLLTLAREEPGTFAPEHEAIASDVANLLSVALYEARLRDALATGRERLHAVIEHLPEGVLVLDEDQRVALVNPAAAVLLETLHPSGPGQPLNALAGVPIADLLRAPAPGSGPWQELHTSGPPRRVFEAAVQELPTERGRMGALVVVREVTAERVMEEQVRHQENLAVVGQLAAGIAHDFNNLLQGILMYAELLLRTQHLEARDAERVQGILTQGLRGADLIRQILDFSRRSVGQREPLELEPVLSSLLRLLRSTIPESVQIELEMPPGSHRILGDATQLQRALTNLAVNARDAMPEGGTLRIVLSSLEVDAGTAPPVAGMATGPWLRLDVSDTGTGISPEARPHIFQPFFTTKAVGRGTGLGLAQVYGIVKGHGGFVDVATAVGSGSTFSLFLPEDRDAATAAPLPRPAAPGEGRGETILLAEDDDAAREVSRDGLEALGYRVLTATDGLDALHRWEARSGEIALVLSDAIMPGMGGVELARELRAQQPGSKVVLMSGYPLPEASRDAVLDWIQKPFSMDELGRRVRWALDTQQGHPEASQEVS
ncbi:MAG: PAS domain S-box protein [Deltaproteobacteria bacterium]|nr:PAS domain S-box protein [Deltaproteobacteria bacterium]